MTNTELSFEFFPPKTKEASQKFQESMMQLLPLSPTFTSVTFGAGGSTQEGTLNTVLELNKQGFCAAPHLSCVGMSRDDIKEVLEKYKNNGINHIITLRGDLPSGMGARGDFNYAFELVEFIRTQQGNQFRIDVAAYPEFHPQAQSPFADLNHFIKKVKAGANSAITQYFYNADAYFRFVDNVQKEGIQIPIIPGIMPITNFTQLTRFSKMCGAEIPSWIAKPLESYGDDKKSIYQFGIEVVTQMCERLIKGGAPGLHFYTLNSAHASKDICEKLSFLSNKS